eukprot:9017836-Alexandrium_andersonii.AAC.1
MARRGSHQANCGHRRLSAGTGIQGRLEGCCRGRSVLHPRAGMLARALVPAPASPRGCAFLVAVHSQQQS